MITQGLLKVSFLKKKLAAEFLNYEAGSIINTITKYQIKFNASRGSVQAAIKALQGEKAITLSSQGASGTKIVKINKDKLLKTLDIQVIIGAMPIPHSLRYQGLASALKTTFGETDFRFAWSFNRGSLSRINGLIKDDYDFIIISKVAANYYKNIYDIKILNEFSDQSYSPEHVWIVKKGIKKINNHIKIGVDKSSFDQFFLTQEITKQQSVQLVEIPYNKILDSIINSDIHAAIWNVDMLNMFDYYKHDLDILKIDSTSLKDYGTATIVSKSIRGDINLIIKNYLNNKFIEEHQQEVLQGALTPNF